MWKKLLAEKDLPCKELLHNIATVLEMAVLDHPQETTVSAQNVHCKIQRNVCLTCEKWSHATKKCRFQQMTFNNCGK